MKIAKYVICGLSLALMVWVFASWCDIVADNTQPNPVHSDYNFFNVILEDWQNPKAML